MTEVINRFNKTHAYIWIFLFLHFHIGFFVRNIIDYIRRVYLWLFHVKHGIIHNSNEKLRTWLNRIKFFDEFIDSSFSKLLTLQNVPQINWKLCEYMAATTNYRKTEHKIVTHDVRADEAPFHVFMRLLSCLLQWTNINPKADKHTKYFGAIKLMLCSHVSTQVRFNTLVEGHEENRVRNKLWYLSLKLMTQA